MTEIRKQIDAVNMIALKRLQSLDDCAAVGALIVSTEKLLDVYEAANACACPVLRLQQALAAVSAGQ